MDQYFGHFPAFKDYDLSKPSSDWFVSLAPLREEMLRYDETPGHRGFLCGSNLPSITSSVKDTMQGLTLTHAERIDYLLREAAVDFAPSKEACEIELSNFGLNPIDGYFSDTKARLVGLIYRTTKYEGLETITQSGLAFLMMGLRRVRRPESEQASPYD